MTWKMIGDSVIGSSHLKSNKGCEDGIRYGLVQTQDEEVLICCASDGAGSARYAAEAAQLVTHTGFDLLSQLVTTGEEITEALLFSFAETLYDQLQAKAAEKEVDIQEFSCTLLGCVLMSRQTVFFQIGDGALVRDDGSGHYVHIWLPQNGEYQNSTSFLIDDSNLLHFKTAILHEPVSEVALFTDGLQLLAFNMESLHVHQPFFTDMFKWLRMVETGEEQAILQEKLTAYLGSDLINRRTDDDKTLFLATRLTHDRTNS
ncbi:MAG: protein phosphatase 2C domain-containing protein [Williamsia sp.]|nr:protein phosphatase 2C domain-containing protein [Williamsia sp.]